ncbi:right-handed parallel beta-helix repeat-containing protein [Streptomyces sp. HSW2009]|uniref:right-handed parallel beta-helix repeat-containing protein n=1 Tax=Streptomyces sp. HSW2009 TaxID=3142890 RepID=UPI0032F034BE
MPQIPPPAPGTGSATGPGPAPYSPPARTADAAENPGGRQARAGRSRRWVGALALAVPLAITPAAATQAAPTNSTPTTPTATTPTTPTTPGTPTPRDATQLYVAPWGDDSWPGSLAKPFATPARAQQAVRALTGRMASDVVVNLRAGTYRLDRPLTLSGAAGDGGRDGHRVVYQAYGYGGADREQVTLSGGRSVTGWRSAAGGVWRADVGDLETRQLFVGGKRAARAALGAGLPGKVTRTATGYVTDSTAPQSWQRPQDVEFVYTFDTAYSEGRCGVAGIAGDARRTTITMDQPCFRRATELYDSISEEGPGMIDPTGVENSASFLRKPGSWYLDRSNPGHHVLSYLPRTGERGAPSDVVAPVLERLVDGTGTAQQPLRDVSLRGLTFSHTTWLGPDRPEGFPHVIGDWYYVGDDPVEQEVRTVPGGVTFRGAAGVTVEGSRFTRLGTQALALTEGTYDSTVRGNVIDDVSAGGIHIEPGGAEPAGARGTRVENNWVHHVGLDYRGSWGILLDQPKGALVAHNQVNDVPYSGIAFLNAGGDATTARGTQVLDNRVFRTNTALIDGGGIYSNGPQGPSFADGARVAGNVVHGVTNPAAGQPEYPPYAIYTDDGGDHITVTRNVVYQNQRSLGGVAPRRVRFTGNFWDDTQVVWWGEAKEVEISGNTKLSATDPERACRANTTCAAIEAGAGLTAEWRSLLTTR